MSTQDNDPKDQETAPKAAQTISGDPSTAAKDPGKSAEELRQERLREAERAREERLAKAAEEKEERLAKAAAEREERLKKAAEEKEQRIAKARAEREAAQKAKEQADRAEAAKLLPSAEEIETTRNQLRKRANRLRQRVIAQFIILVILPTVAAAAYLHFMATEFYEARSVISISRLGNDGGQEIGGLLGSLGGGTSNLHELFMANQFVSSQALIDHLEDELGVISTFSSEAIDPLQRLRDYPWLNILKRDQFHRFVESSIDVQTNLMSLYVRAPDRAQAVEISYAILEQTSDWVNKLAVDMFNARIQSAETTVEQARTALTEAQAALVRLQLETQEINPRLRVEGIYATLQALEAERQQIIAQIAREEVRGAAVQIPAAQSRALLERTEERIATQRALLGHGAGETPLAGALMRSELQQLQVRIAEETLSTALQELLTARRSAELGRFVFQVVVPPQTANQPEYPDIPVALLMVFVLSLVIFSTVRMAWPR